MMHAQQDDKMSNIRYRAALSEYAHQRADILFRLGALLLECCANVLPYCSTDLVAGQQQYTVVMVLPPGIVQRILQQYYTSRGKRRGTCSYGCFVSDVFAMVRILYCCEYTRYLTGTWYMIHRTVPRGLRAYCCIRKYVPWYQSGEY